MYGLQVQIQPDFLELGAESMRELLRAVVPLHDSNHNRSNTDSMLWV